MAKAKRQFWVAVVDDDAGAGMLSVLHKPYRSDTLLQLVQKVAAGYSPTH
jgi:hypothetical protein